MLKKLNENKKTQSSKKNLLQGDKSNILKFFLKNLIHFFLISHKQPK